MTDAVRKRALSWIFLRGCSLGVVRIGLKKFSSRVEFGCLEELASALKENSGKVLVMAGAGISTPSGIPDFRSPGSGLYDNLKKYNLPYAEAIFDIRYFDVDPKPFFNLAAELRPGGRYRPNAVHYFVKLLEMRGNLLRMYSQNIDGLERLAGIGEEKLVEAHGSFYSATCRRCSAKYAIGDIVGAIDRRQIPRCAVEGCKGVVKPDIVFFGEMLPEKFYNYPSDAVGADFLLILGTSLEVYPFAGIADSVREGVPRLLLNRDLVGDVGARESDCWMSGDIVSSVKLLAAALGWESELEQLVAASKSREST